MNLVIGSCYHYAAELGYHYTFGTATLLIFMAILNCSDLKEEAKRTVITAAMAAALITAVPLLTQNLFQYENYQKYKSYYAYVESCLASIPDDACVIAAPNYLPHVANRNEIYQLNEDDYVTASGNVTAIKDMNKYDYFVLDAKDGNTRGAIAILESNGYTLFAECKDYIVIYKK